MFEDPEAEKAQFFGLMSSMDHLTIALLGLIISFLSITIAHHVANSKFLPQRPLIQTSIRILAIFIVFFVMTYGSVICITGVDGLLNIQRATIVSPTRRNITRSINIVSIYGALQRSRVTMDVYVWYILVLLYTTACITEDY